MNEYPLAPLDRMNHGVTAFLIVFMAVALIDSIVAPYPVTCILGTIVILLVIILGIAAAYSPKAITIMPAGLGIVRRKMSVLVFPWSDFTEYRVLRDRWAWQKGNIFNFIKLWATAGFLGYYGWFYLKGRGVVRCYATHLDSAIVLTGARTVIITPADLDTVSGLIRAQVKSTGNK